MKTHEETATAVEIDSLFIKYKKTVNEIESLFARIFVLPSSLL